MCSIKSKAVQKSNLLSSKGIGSVDRSAWLIFPSRSPLISTPKDLVA